MSQFDPLVLSVADYELVLSMLGGRQERVRNPDLVIGEDGVPYLNRWWLTPHSKTGGTYLHVQTGDDPQRPIHDHPWDNMSVLLRGAYKELWDPAPWLGWESEAEQRVIIRDWKAGDVVFRRAGEAHRLLLPVETSYTITLFSTGPVVRDWGFYFKDGWRSAKDTVELTAEGWSVLNEKARRDNTG